LEAFVKTPVRLTSLDAFRGLTMAAMVIVNNPGDWGHAYWPLLHAPWHGWTPTDLIFPFFLFIVGVSMTLSRGTMGDPWKIVRRGFIIFGLGMFLSGFPRFPLETWRIPGVLQRIALCYVAAAFIFRSTSPVAGDGDLRLWTHARRLLILAVGLTLAYWAVLMLVPPPGGTAGDIRPAQDLGAYIDRIVFGSHVWKQSKTWDPEHDPRDCDHDPWTDRGAVAGLVSVRDAQGGRHGPGRCRGHRHRVDLEPRLSYQQELVDEFVRVVYCRRRVVDLGGVLLAH
jgi:predicted acyltransferase